MSTITSDDVDHRIDVAALTLIKAMNEHGLPPLQNRVAKLEYLCDKLVEKNRQLREHIAFLERAVGQAADGMDIDTATAGMEKLNVGAAQADAVIGRGDKI
ncbi:hypothetical protein FPQ18DRAFT_402804 [Pyronema domesticum]|nr:hypothetical protein FPQ18DRAFT_402804 [Pyronema domesticum]